MISDSIFDVNQCWFRILGLLYKQYISRTINVPSDFLLYKVGSKLSENEKYEKKKQKIHIILCKIHFLNANIVLPVCWAKNQYPYKFKVERLRAQRVPFK